MKANRSRGLLMENSHFNITATFSGAAFVMEVRNFAVVLKLQKLMLRTIYRRYLTTENQGGYDINNTVKRSTNTTFRIGMYFLAS